MPGSKRASQDPEAVGAPTAKVARTDADARTGARSALQRVLVDAAGVDLRDPAGFIVSDPFALRRRVEAVLAMDASLTSAFLDQLFDLLNSSHDSLRRFLLPSLACAPDSQPGVEQEQQQQQQQQEQGLASSAALTLGAQDSMLKLLLNVDVLQPRLVQFLLEKLPEFDDSSNTDALHNLPKLVLAQLRWLDRIVDAEELANGLVMALEVCQPSVQRELISVVPDIVDDAQHDGVVAALQEMLRSDTTLTVPVIDSLANLNLRPDLLAQVCASVFQCLHSAAISDLPVVVRFLLQTVTPATATEVVRELRAAVQLNVLSDDSTRNGERMTLEALRSGLRFHSVLVTTFLREISNVTGAANQRPMDLWVLLMLHDVAMYRKQVETLWRKKVGDGSFTPDLVRSAVPGHGDALRDSFPAMLALADVLVRSSGARAHRFAQEMLATVFLEFSDDYHVQELLSSIVTHIGSGDEAEVSAALAALDLLLQRNLTRVRAFATYLKGVLDYLGRLSHAHARVLFAMFAKLGYNAAGEAVDQGLLDDMMIIIRKHVCHVDTAHQRLGIITALALVHRLAYCSGADASPALAEDTATTADTCDEVPLTHVSDFCDERFARVRDLLDMVDQHCKTSPLALAMFYDEMAQTARSGTVHPRVLQWLSEALQDALETSCLVELDAWATAPDAAGTSAWIPLMSAYNLDGDDAAIMLNLMPKVMPVCKGTGGMRAASYWSVLWCLPPKLRLIAACEVQYAGDAGLSAIDALLGCPLLMFDADAVLDASFAGLPQAKREACCLALFVAGNWFREVINAFCTQSRDAEMKGKLFKRLGQLIEMDRRLDQCLAVTPTFSLAAYLPGLPTPSGGARERLTPFLRRLSLDAATILTFDEHYVRQSFDSRSNGGTEEVVSLEPALLAFLVSNLHQSLSQALPSARRRGARGFPGGRRRGRRAAADVALLAALTPDPDAGKAGSAVLATVVDVLPALRLHLDTLMAFVRSSRSALGDSDEVDELDKLGDEPGGDASGSPNDAGKPDAITVTAVQQAEATLTLLMQAIQLVLGSAVLSDPSNLDEQRRALTALLDQASRSPETGEQRGCLALRRLLFAQLAEHQVAISDFDLATAFVRFLAAILAADTDLSDERDHVAAMAAAFLQRPWRRVVRNEAIIVMLKQRIVLAASPLEVLDDLIVTVLPTCRPDTTATDAWPTLGKGSFVAYYRVCIAELAGYLGRLDTSQGRWNDAEASIQVIYALNRCALAFQALIQFTKLWEAPALWLAALRHGRGFLDAFLRCMPMLEAVFARHQNDIVATLKNVQSSTRILQALCANGKVLADARQIAMVPALKKTLETLIYRVKAMLEANQCLGAFWLGNLKHRSLSGREVSSQMPAAIKEDRPASTSSDDDDDNDDGDDDDGDDDDDELSDASE